MPNRCLICGFGWISGVAFECCTFHALYHLFPDYTSSVSCYLDVLHVFWDSTLVVEWMFCTATNSLWVNHGLVYIITLVSDALDTRVPERCVLENLPSVKVASVCSEPETE